MGVTQKITFTDIGGGGGGQKGTNMHRMGFTLVKTVLSCSQTLYYQTLNHTGLENMSVIIYFLFSDHVKNHYSHSNKHFPSWSAQLY